MGATDQAILNQSKKAQRGETNERLDALVAEVRRTNELLGQLVEALVNRRTTAWTTPKVLDGMSATQRQRQNVVSGRGSPAADLTTPTRGL